MVYSTHVCILFLCTVEATVKFSDIRCVQNELWVYMRWTSYLHVLYMRCTCLTHVLMVYIMFAHREYVYMYVCMYMYVPIAHMVYVHYLGLTEGACEMHISCCHH